MHIIKHLCVLSNIFVFESNILFIMSLVNVFTRSQEADGVSSLSHHGDWAGEGVSDQYSLGCFASLDPLWNPAITHV